MGSYYGELYIYWINRAITEKEEELFDESYLGNWVEDGFSFLFFNKDAHSNIMRLLKRNNDLMILDQYHMTYEQWQGGIYESLQIDKFIIIPPWHNKDVKIKRGLIPISLDPGLVFGNCLHPTTRDCIRAISWFLERYHAKKMLDLGTGTGILAIVAAKLGVEKVVAVDINPLCVKTARKNVIQNGLEDRINVVHAKAEEIISEDADLTVANLSYDVIVNLISSKDFLNNYSIILSGMLRSQWFDVRDLLIRKGYEVLRQWDHEMIWYTATAIKKGGANN